MHDIGGRPFMICVMHRDISSIASLHSAYLNKVHTRAINLSEHVIGQCHRDHYRQCSFNLRLHTHCWYCIWDYPLRTGTEDLARE
jgi:hypothetical protein